MVSKVNYFCCTGNSRMCTCVYCYIISVNKSCLCSCKQVTLMLLHTMPQDTILFVQCVVECYLYFYAPSNGSPTIYFLSLLQNVTQCPRMVYLWPEQCSAQYSFWKKLPQGTEVTPVPVNNYKASWLLHNWHAYPAFHVKYSGLLFCGLFCLYNHIVVNIILYDLFSYI